MKNSMKINFSRFLKRERERKTFFDDEKFFIFIHQQIFSFVAN